MIKVRNYNEFFTILESHNNNLKDLSNLQTKNTTLSKSEGSYQTLVNQGSNNITNIHYLACDNYNLLLVAFNHKHQSKDQSKDQILADPFSQYYKIEEKMINNIYVGVLLVDLLKLVNELYPDLIEDNEYAQEIVSKKYQLRKTNVNDFKILGYFTNQNTFQITLQNKNSESLPDDLSKTIILFPTATTEIIEELMNNVEEKKITEDFKILFNKHLLTPILNFNTAFSKLQSISQIIPRNDVTDFEEPMSLIEILKYYHAGCRELGILGKLLKPSDTDDVVFNSINTLTGQRNLKIENFDKIYLTSWDTSGSDFKILSQMINEAYLIKRKARDGKHQRKTNRDDDSDKGARVHKKENLKY